MAASSAIIDLRTLLAERFPQPLTPPNLRLTTGLPAIDELLGGGLPKSAITELSSPHLSAGTALLLYALLQNAHQARYFLALVDGRDSFDPQPLGNSRLRNLLWVRCTKALDALQSRRSPSARWEFPPGRSRSCPEFLRRASKNSANELVSVAAPGGSSADRFSGSHAREHHQQRAIKTLTR